MGVAVHDIANSPRFLVNRPAVLKNEEDHRILMLVLNPDVLKADILDRPRDRRR